MTDQTTKTFRDASSASPLIVNFGGGVDSTAILVRLAQLFQAGDATARPDLVLFADVGAETPETYENVDRVSAWLVSQGLPPVTVVSRATAIKTRSPYVTILENCIANETLPSEAFGFGSCSIKWKHEPMDRFLFGTKRKGGEDGWLARNGFAGQKPTKLIGYDATETCKGKRGSWAKVKEDAVAFMRYPLVEWSWTREICQAEIAAAGLEVPPKSACFFCPNAKPAELEALEENHPVLFLQALAVEENARTGRHGLRKVEGLWRRTRKADGRPGSWLAWAKQTGLLESAQVRSGKSLPQVLAELRASVERRAQALAV